VIKDLPQRHRLHKGTLKFLALSGAVLALNACLSFHNIWPTPWIRLQPEISIEALVIILLISLGSSRGLLEKTAGRLTLVSILIFLIIGRYIDVTAPSLYGRPVNLYWDLQHIPGVAAMLIADVSTVIILLFGAIISLAFGSLFWCISALLRLLKSCGQTGRRWLNISLVLCMLAYTAGMTSDLIHWERGFSIPVSLMYARQALFLYQVKQDSRGAENSSAGLQYKAGTIELDKKDFHLVFLESYGTTVFKSPSYYMQIEPHLNQLTEVTRKLGWNMVTGVYHTPTFGGASWLSHATLMTGQWISSNMQYHQLLTTESETLANWFRNSGYRITALLPGLKRHWPEGRFYNYDKVWDARSLAYPGPDFGWWRIPDQFSLARFYDKEGKQGQRSPLFNLFATITSHMPFNPIPPIEQDWSKLLTGNPYSETGQTENSSAILYGEELQSSYSRAIGYDLQLVSNLLALTSLQHPLIIVLGDHQPPAIISGHGAPWTVPVHVFSHDKTILQKFTKAGFVAGLNPEDQSLGRLDDLHHLILRAIGSPRKISQNEN
jgi:hypothetical protein